MDPAQQWAVTIAAQALEDYGYPNRPLDTERTAVVLGTAMGGETALRYNSAYRLSRIRACPSSRAGVSGTPARRPRRNPR